MFGTAKTVNSNVENAKIQNCDVWIRQNTEILKSVWKGKILEFECLRKAKHWIPMSGKAKIQNSKVWKSKSTGFQSLKSKNTEFQCLEKPKYKTPMLKKNKIHNLLERQNTEFQCLKSQNTEFHCLEKPKHWIPFSNPLSPKSDQHEISHCNINANRVVMEITDMMITQDEFAWIFSVFLPTTSIGNEQG